MNLNGFLSQLPSRPRPDPHRSRLRGANALRDARAQSFDHGLRHTYDGVYGLLKDLHSPERSFLDVYNRSDSARQIVTFESYFLL